MKQLSRSRIPCLCITWRYLTITFEHGRIKTWRFPAFSALLSVFKASANTLIRTMMHECPLKRNVFKFPLFPSQDPAAGPARGRPSLGKTVTQWLIMMIRVNLIVSCRRDSASQS
jgi:hypothetical protein